MNLLELFQMWVNHPKEGSGKSNLDNHVIIASYFKNFLIIIAVLGGICVLVWEEIVFQLLKR